VAADHNIYAVSKIMTASKHSWIFLRDHYYTFAKSYISGRMNVQVFSTPASPLFIRSWWSQCLLLQQKHTSRAAVKPCWMFKGEGEKKRFFYYLLKTMADKSPFLCCRKTHKRYSVQIAIFQPGLWGKEMSRLDRRKLELLRWWEFTFWFSGLCRFAISRRQCR
jgi:hypothetical protein